MAMVRLVDRDDILVQDEIDSTDLTSMICPTETDAAILEDLAFYLEQSVESVLGNVIKYNPMGYASGKNDILVSNILNI